MRKTFFIPGDLRAYAALLGVPREAQESTARVYSPHFTELENHGVFSRWRDIRDGVHPRLKVPVDFCPGLNGDAIVSRRLLREHLETKHLSEVRSMAGKKGAKASNRVQRAMRQKGQQSDQQTGQQKVSKKPAKGSANGHEPSPCGPEVCDGVSQQGGQQEASLSSTSTYPCNKGSSHLNANNEFAEEKLKLFTHSIVRITGNDKFERPGHQKRISKILKHPSGTQELSTLLDDVEKRIDPRTARGRGDDAIRNPGGFISTALLRLHDELYKTETE